MSVKSRRHYDIERSVRDKIEVGRIISRLQNHIFNGDEMTKTQVSAAAILLKKTLPDLSESQVTSIKQEVTDYSREELVALLEQSRRGNDTVGASEADGRAIEPDSVH